MSKEILSQLAVNIKSQYDLIPFGDWGDLEKGARPAPYALGQKYSEEHELWSTAYQDRVGIRLNNLVLVDYDGNKPEAVGEIPTVEELASALGYSSQQAMFDKSLIQWNDELTSLHFLFLAPPDFNTTEFKQSNQGTKAHFWKHIDIKTGNQLVYLKQGKTSRLLDIQTYDPTPDVVIEELRDKATKTLAEDFDYSTPPTEHQERLAVEWLHEACEQLESMGESSGRNAQLNLTACTAGGLVAGGSLDNTASYTLLYEAAIKSGLERSETINTLKSGWEEGYKTPRKDAPYKKPSASASEVFASHLIVDTNIDVSTDRELTELIQQGHLDATDPNVGILHTHYTYFMENWVMNKEGRFIHRTTLSDYNKTAFDALHNKDMPSIPGSKTFKKFRASEVFESANPTIVTDLFYMPGGDDIVTYERKTYLNSYFPYLPDRPDEPMVQEAYRLIYNHLNWLFQDPVHQRFMLDWLAWQVQRPGELVGWVPLIIGCLGDGKSILFELITAAVGSNNTKLMGNKSIQGNFQDWATNSSVTAFEELKVDARHSRQVANDMKPFITEKRVSVNGKGSKETTIPNFSNYMAFSNYGDPIAINNGDRRWFILHTNHFGKNSVMDRTQGDMKLHFDGIKDLVNKEENHPAVHHVLMDHQISDEFLNHRFRAPQTVFSLELVSETVSEKEARLQEFLDNAHFVDGRQGRLIDNEYGFQIQDFRGMMPENWFSGMDKKPSAKLLGRWLRNLGYELATRQVDDGFVKTFKRGV